MYRLETEVPNVGTIKAVRSGKPRDYLLIDERGVVTWLDELAIDKLLEVERMRNGGVRL